MCALRYTYLDEADLFVYWYRNHFLADPDSWELASGEPQLRPEAHVIHILRMLAVLECSAPERETSESENLLFQYWGDTSDCLALTRGQIRRMSEVVSRAFHSSSVFGDWRTAARKYIKRLDTTHCFDVRRARTTSQKMAEHLDAGRVCRYPTERGDSSTKRFLFTQLLSHAYLGKLKAVGGNGNALLERDSKTGHPKYEPTRDARILFDRRGGTFVPELSTIRWYFRIRSTYLMSLWDMATKQKSSDKTLHRILQEIARG
jgi:hypothetical protein